MEPRAQTTRPNPNTVSRITASIFFNIFSSPSCPNHPMVPLRHLRSY